MESDVIIIFKCPGHTGDYLMAQVFLLKRVFGTGFTTSGCKMVQGLVTIFPWAKQNKNQNILVLCRKINNSGFSTVFQMDFLLLISLLSSSLDSIWGRMRKGNDKLMINFYELRNRTESYSFYGWVTAESQLRLGLADSLNLYSKWNSKRKSHSKTKKINFEISHRRRFLDFFPGQHSEWRVCPLQILPQGLWTVNSSGSWPCCDMGNSRARKPKKPDFLRFLDCWKDQLLQVLEEPSRDHLFWNLEPGYCGIIHTTTQTNHEGDVI